MHVIAFDPFVSEERYRELGVEKAESPEDIYAPADFITLHLPRTAETHGDPERRRRSRRCATACASSTARAAS